MLKALRNSVIAVFYPQQCIVCGQAVENIDDGVACHDCWESTRLFKGPEMLCSKCGAFFNESGVQTELFCHKCDDQHFAKARSVGIYEKALAAAALYLKRESHIPERLHSLIVNSIERNSLQGSSLIIPVPLSHERRLERGFNQAETIASVIAKHTGFECDFHSLIRSRHTPMHRVAMDKKARELTVKNAFEVKRPKLIAGRSVLLVDDIFTSGATASACAKVLKKNGASEVNVFTIARAVIK